MKTPNDTHMICKVSKTISCFFFPFFVPQMPELIHHKGDKAGKSRSVLFALQNVGFLIGAAIILVIALYEDALIQAI